MKFLTTLFTFICVCTAFAQAEKKAEFTLEPDPLFRRTFIRNSPVALHLIFRNDTANSMQNLKVSFKVDDPAIPEQVIDIKNVDAHTAIPLVLQADSTLMPGNYKFGISVSDAEGKVLAFSQSDFYISPGLGDSMPVVLWGWAPFKDLKEAGFTHFAAYIVPPDGDFSNAMTPELISGLDNALRNELFVTDRLHGKNRFLKPKRFLRRDKDGKIPQRPNIEASNPAVVKEFKEVVEATMKAVGEHPALQAALINSEVRDSSSISFGGVDPENFKSYSGFDIPATITDKYPMPYTNTKNFPWDRVINSKSQEMIFYRWFWREGDGWNPLQSTISESYHKYAHPGFWTYYDPAVRVPPQWGSGGTCDAVNQWTYAYPDPIKIGQAADELAAMADGCKGQKIFSMTQAIWYKKYTAPDEQNIENPPEWAKKYKGKNIQFITIAPDALKEAFWAEISRRIDGIMYFGAPSLLVPNSSKMAFTNPQSRKDLAELVHTVIQPLGPVLKKIPERPAELAILESFASSIYARKHFSFGWSNNWVADLHLALQWAHFQPSVIFDEHILRGQLPKTLKVIFVPGLEVVEDSVLEKLNEFRANGGIIVGDEFTTPALMLDLRISSVKRDSTAPLETKIKLQKLGREIATGLKDFYTSPLAADSQDLVIRRRGNDSADYIFLVNDKREFGDYIGQWGLVAEKGVELESKVTIRHPSQAGYDLALHKEIPIDSSGGISSFENTVSPGGGRIILLLDRKIANIKLKLPQTDLRRGKGFSFSIDVCDEAGHLIDAYLPVEITITGSNGKLLPGSGYYALAKGHYDFNDSIAANAPTGKAGIKVKCLASGKTAAGTIYIE